METTLKLTINRSSILVVLLLFGCSENKAIEYPLDDSVHHITLRFVNDDLYYDDNKYSAIIYMSDYKNREYDTVFRYDDLYINESLDLDIRFIDNKLIITDTTNPNNQQIYDLNDKYPELFNDSLESNWGLQPEGISNLSVNRYHLHSIRFTRTFFLVNRQHIFYFSIRLFY